MSSEKELLRLVSDPEADLAQRTFAAQLIQEIHLRRIAIDLRTLVIVFVVIPVGAVLLLLIGSAVAVASLALFVWLQ